MTASVIASQKYSWSLSRLKSLKGSTAIEFSHLISLIIPVLGSFFCRNWPKNKYPKTMIMAPDKRIPAIHKRCIRFLGVSTLVFFLGNALSSVEISFSILLSSEANSSTPWYLFSLSFSMHFRITVLNSSGICVLNSLGSGGISVLCLNAILKEVSPSKGIFPVIISKMMIPNE
ncbi:hypothetical protein ES703_93601 [subsurface metagenome]